MGEISGNTEKTSVITDICINNATIYLTSI